MATAYYDDKLEKVIENGIEYPLNEWMIGKSKAEILQVLSAPSKAETKEKDEIELMEPMFRTVTFENLLLTDKNLLNYQCVLI